MPPLNLYRGHDIKPVTSIDLTTGTPVAYTDAAGYPAGATVLQESSGNVSNAAAAVTLAKAVDKMVYLTGFDVSFAGATSASNVLLTITGLEGDDRTYVIPVPAGADGVGGNFARTFDPPLPAEDLNTDIVVSLAALGAGNTHACVNAQGFRV